MFSSAVAFANARRKAEARRQISDAKLPIRSVSFINPTMAALENAGPPKTHKRQLLPSGPPLPEGRYIALLAYRAAGDNKR